jgi:hypothetical protein
MQASAITVTDTTVGRERHEPAAVVPNPSTAGAVRCHSYRHSTGFSSTPRVNTSNVVVGGSLHRCQWHRSVRRTVATAVDGLVPSPPATTVSARFRCVACRRWSADGRADFRIFAIEMLRSDFEQHGEEVIRRVREGKPEVYLASVISLMPRQKEKIERRRQQCRHACALSRGKRRSVRTDEPSARTRISQSRPRTCGIEHEHSFRSCRQRGVDRAGGARASPPRFYLLITARSKYAQNAFAIRICFGVLQFGSNICGVPTRMHTHRARDVATFRRWRLKRNSIPCGASSWLDVAIE